MLNLYISVLPLCMKENKQCLQPKWKTLDILALLKDGSRMLFLDQAQHEAELLWVINMLISNFLFNSGSHLSNIHEEMFPGSEPAVIFTLCNKNSFPFMLLCHLISEDGHLAIRGCQGAMSHLPLKV